MVSRTVVFGFVIALLAGTNLPVTALRMTVIFFIYLFFRLRTEERARRNKKSITLRYVPILVYNEDAVSYDGILDGD